MRSRHRLRRRVLSRARWVRLGDFDIESDTDLARPVDYRITKHVPHPDYKRTERYNDIALFQLETDVPFSAFVRPICLNAGPLRPDPSPQVVTGWGAISTGSLITTGLLNRLHSLSNSHRIQITGWYRAIKSGSGRPLYFILCILHQRFWVGGQKIKKLIQYFYFKTNCKK